MKLHFSFPCPYINCSKFVWIEILSHKQCVPAKIQFVSNSLFFFLVEDEMGNASKWKDSLAERTVLRQNTNLMQLVYGKSLKSTTSIDEVQGGSDDEESDDEEFFKPKGEGKKVCLFDASLGLNLSNFL